MNDWGHIYNHFGMCENFSNEEFLDRIDMSSLENATLFDDSVFESALLQEYKDFKQFWDMNGFVKDNDFVDFTDFLHSKFEDEEDPSLSFNIHATVFDKCHDPSFEPLQLAIAEPLVDDYVMPQVQPIVPRFECTAHQPVAPRIENIYIKRCAENNVFKIGRTILPSKLKKGTQIFQCKNSRLMKKRIIEAFRKKYKQARSYGMDCFEGSYNSMVISIGSILVKEK